MTGGKNVLVLGGSGRTGRRVVRSLVESGCRVRAIVRCRESFLQGFGAPSGDPGAQFPELTEASFLSMDDAAVAEHVRGCDAIVSCLGHNTTIAGVFGPPRDLVTRAVGKVCRAIESVGPATPVRLVLMSSVSVFFPGEVDARRGPVERAFMKTVCAIVPAAADNQKAAEFLRNHVGQKHPLIQWVVVRPDTLTGGAASVYDLHEGIVDSLFRPASTAMNNIACFMRDLVNDDSVWERWKGRMPVIVDRR